MYWFILCTNSGNKDIFAEIGVNLNFRMKLYIEFLNKMEKNYVDIKFYVESKVTENSFFCKYLVNYYFNRKILKVKLLA